MTKIVDVRFAIDDRFAQLPEFGEELAKVLSRSTFHDVRYLGGSVMGYRPPERVTIRRADYRGEQGFTITSNQNHSIFTKTRASAEQIKARLKACEEIRTEDWAL